jgi:hypothetical protein
MKILLVLITLFIAKFSNGQKLKFSNYRDSMIERSANYLQLKYNLSKEQKSQIIVARKNQSDCMDSLLFILAKEPIEKKQRMTKCEEKYIDRLKKIFTDKQWDLFKKEQSFLEEQQKQKRKAKMN